MGKEGSRKEKLLAGLAGESLFRGVALLSADGEVMRSRGESDALASAPDRQGGSDASQSEDVYVVSLDEGYLVVAFDSQVEFEPVEALVDDWLERLELD